jgi:hypothetical protein
MTKKQHRIFKTLNIIPYNEYMQNIHLGFDEV